MTAAELIEALKVLPPETRVMVRGYEGGYCDADTPGEIQQMCLDVNKAWYYGPHEPVGDYSVKGNESHYTIVPSVVL